ncbi:MAG: hypothetical protein K6357_00630 [Elusimicrobiota bacterium]
MIFHIFNKSIEGYQIFNDENDYKRFILALRYYSYSKKETSISFRSFIKKKLIKKKHQ